MWLNQIDDDYFVIWLYLDREKVQNGPAVPSIKIHTE